MTTADTPIFPRDLMALLGITHPNTLRVQIKTGKVPPPDVKLSAKTRYWHRPTLVRAGLLPDGGSENAAQNAVVTGAPRRHRCPTGRTTAGRRGVSG